VFSICLDGLNGGEAGEEDLFQDVPMSVSEVMPAQARVRAEK
jgi:hypothetical protein